jgi:hypothetical protein
MMSVGMSYQTNDREIQRQSGQHPWKTADLRINLNIDGEPIASTSHTHPSHSETSRLLTTSLSLGVPVPHGTQCIRGVPIPQV